MDSALRLLADYVKGVLLAVLAGNAATRARWQDALPLLQKAVLDTQQYGAELQRGKPVDRTTESRLVDAWRAAASGFYTLNGGLAERLQLKAEYWTEPEAWTRQQILDAGISLQEIAELTRQLLRER